jgi:hypothetical protein
VSSELKRLPHAAPHIQGARHVHKPLDVWGPVILYTSCYQTNMLGPKRGDFHEEKRNFAILTAFIGNMGYGETRFKRVIVVFVFVVNRGALGRLLIPIARART